MRPAGVVADHAADGAAVVRRGVGRKRQLMALGLVAESVQDDARLYPGESVLRVDLEDVIHVLRKIENDSHIAALPGQTGARSPRQNRRAILPARRHRRAHVLGIAGNHQANGNLTVVRSVRGKQGAAAAIEADFAAHLAPQGFFQGNGLRKRIDRFRVRAWREGTERLHSFRQRFDERPLACWRSSCASTHSI